MGRRTSHGRVLAPTVCGPTSLGEAVGPAPVGLGRSPARVKLELFRATGG